MLQKNKKSLVFKIFQFDLNFLDKFAPTRTVVRFFSKNLLLFKK